MLDFQKLPSTSSVWIYQSNRPFSENETQSISEKTTNFVSNWKSHGNSLQASFILQYNQFLVLAVNTEHTPTSGCSIDASVHFIKLLENEFDIELLNKLNIAYKKDDAIVTTKLSDFQKLISAKKIQPTTTVFNNLINTKHDFLNNWETTIENSWHKQLLDI